MSSKRRENPKTHNLSVYQWLDFREIVLRLPAGTIYVFFFFYIFNASRRSLASTPTPIRFVLDAVSRQVKWPEREADYSLSYRAEVKNEWNYTSISSYAFTARKWKTSPLTLAYMVKKLPAFSGTRRPYLGVLY